MRSADKIFTNGIILTQDNETSESSELAIKGSRVLAVGKDLSVHRDDQTEIIDLGGAVVVPGFIDAHIHLLWGGESLLTIPLHKADSKVSFMRSISRFAEGRQAGSWLKGGGWNEHLFVDDAFPHRSWLDEAAPGHPMILHRHDGHSGIASSTALDLAGITKHTPGPDGGVIDRDPSGEPTGVLRDSAMELVMSLIPKETESELLNQLDVAQNYLLERGVTAVGDMIYDMNHFHFLQKMARQHKLKVRITAYTPLLKWHEMSQLLDSGIYEDEWFQFKGFKAFCDGSLGSRTALMLEPYTDAPDLVGLHDTDWDDTTLVEKIISEIDSMGYQVAVHAIGDRANREVLDVFQTVISKNGSRDRRFRVEHAQHLHPDDQIRFSQMGVIASVQPAHCVDDARYADQLLGKRCSYAYPFQTLHERGTQLAFGSDWPVSQADPVTTIHGAIKRAGWYMGEAVDFTTALKAHTSDAAYAGFREDDIGRLRVGHFADLVILDPQFLDLKSTAVPPSELIVDVYVNGQKESLVHKGDRS